MKKIIIIVLFILLYSVYSVSCKKRIDNQYPFIEYGIARLSGKISKDDVDKITPNSFSITVMNPILSDRLDYDIQIKDDGTFSIEIPVVSNYISGIVSDIYTGGICLAPNHETILNIHYDKNGEKHISLKNDLGYTSTDMISLLDVISNAIRNNNVTPDDYNVTPAQYSGWVIEQIKRIVDDIELNSCLSKKIKTVVVNELKLFYLDVALLDYSAVMQKKLSQYSNGIDSLDLFVKEPDKTYYSFLKYFDLNNPDYFSCSYYPIVLRHLLKKDALNIQPIGDQNPKEWITKIKRDLKDILGDDNSFLFDMLVSTSYAEQLNNMKPFSAIQEQNIKTYFQKCPVFSEVLFNENERVLLLLKNDVISFNIKPTPNVSKEEIMNAIISKYKGKIIFVDFWATWCRPCLEAIKKIKPLKDSLINKDVVFVYITNSSSPQKLWKEHINEIGGEHYYLTEKEWEYIMDSFDFSGIPSYLIYDKNGVIENKFTGYQGNKTLRKMIEDIIKQ